MQLNKSYRLLRFLNRRHGWVLRHGLAACGFAGCLVATHSVTLAKGLHAEFAGDLFDIAFRKAARHARHLSPRFNALNDPFFNFTMHCNAIELQALDVSLDRIRSKLPLTEYLTDKLYIRATQIHDALRQGDNADAIIDDFHALADQALAQVKVKPEPAPAPSKPHARSPDFDKSDAVRALHDLVELLPLDTWPWFVVSGTFLGLHREGGFLAHDYDIDIGINAENVSFDTLLTTLSSSATFEVKKIDHHMEVLRDEHGNRHLRERPSIIKIIHVNGLQVDVFIHYTDDGITWHGSSIHRWENTPFKLVPRQLEGITVNTPDDADRYLTENYGDWHTPCIDFDCTTGTANLVLTNNFLSTALFIKRYTHFARHDPARAEALLATLCRIEAFHVQGDRITLSRHL